MVACSAIGALNEMFDAADRNDRNDEEERNKAHTFLHDERHARAALSAVHLMIGASLTPSEKACANDKHIIPLKISALRKLPIVFSNL